jgi:hypothetical protein
MSFAPDGSPLPEPGRYGRRKARGRPAATGAATVGLLATLGLGAPTTALAQNVVGAMNELAPYCLGAVCLGMSIEEARTRLRQLQLTEELTPSKLCQGGRYKDVAAVASPNGEASVAVQFRRYAGAGGLDVQYRLWSISLTESAAPGARRMSPSELERLKQVVTQRYELQPNRHDESLWLRQLAQWQLGVTTRYSPTTGSSIILYALAEQDMARWLETQPGCGPDAGILRHKPPAAPAPKLTPPAPMPRGFAA